MKKNFFILLLTVALLSGRICYPQFTSNSIANANLPLMPTDSTIASGAHGSDTLYVEGPALYTETGVLDEQWKKVLILNNLPKRYKKKDYDLALARKYSDSITFLSITDSEFKNIPEIHFYFRNLKAFDLSGNHLVRLRFEQDFQNENVTDIDLSHNNIRTIDKSFTAGFPNVSHLDMSFNSLTDYDMSQLASFPNLKVLDVAGNNIEELASVLSTCTNLEALFIAANRVRTYKKGATSAEGMAVEYKNLTVLDLMDNDLSELGAEFLAPTLEIVVLTGNQFLDWPGFLAGSRNLKELYLSGNPLQGTPDLQGKFAHLKNLAHLDLSRDYFEQHALYFIFELPNVEIQLDSNTLFVPSRDFKDYRKYARTYQDCYGDGDPKGCYDLSRFLMRNGFMQAYMKQLDYIIESNEAWQCTDPWITASYKKGVAQDSTLNYDMNIGRSRKWFLGRENIDFETLYSVIESNAIFNTFKSVCACGSADNDQVKVLISSACSRIIDELMPLTPDIRGRYEENTDDITRLRQEIPKIEKELQELKLKHAKRNSSEMRRINAIKDRERKKTAMSTYRKEEIAQTVLQSTLKLSMSHKEKKIEKTVAENSRLKALMAMIEALIGDAQQKL